MSKADENASPYKDTVNLPRTDFPMKADLVIREPVRLAQWEKNGLYGKIQARRKAQKAPRFILHDGPPFANGDVHMGTALNKVIKDLVLKSKTMAGFETPYIPGWDCHGLPIEFKVVKETTGLSAPEIRRRSEEFARKFIDIQRNSFRRLGVFGDWYNPYLTLSAGYEAHIVRFFATCVEKNLIYRSKRPVQWSYGAKTALAEAEVEHKKKVSPAIFVKFKALTGPVAEAGGSFVIWTTTPWTLPANLGIMVKADYTYILGDFTHEDGRVETLVVVKPLVESFAAKTGFRLDEKSAVEVKGGALAGSEAQHPFLPRGSKVIATTFVTDDTGTGQVHTAPGHGKEDYQAGREHGLGLLSPVDDDGKFTAESGLTGEDGLPDLTGMLVFDANGPIIKLLAERGVLLGKENYQHDYPHCWRSKTPIIFRSVEQFFLKIEDIRADALREIGKVQWLPHWGQARIHGTAESRPDWCISRQRTWGVPLPVFMKPDGEPVVDAAVARKVADLIEKEGTNVWFEKSDAELTALLGLPTDWIKGRDTLDVWIDSGCSSMAVTESHPELGNGGIADLYIEATDQHRGWFQSSLMCSVIHRGTAPYKTVMTHGFVTDTTGKKISKSEQDNAAEQKGEAGQKEDKEAKKKKVSEKPMTADHYYNKYGADLVRLWVAGVDWQNDVPFSQELFEQNGDVYRRFRNTLRILLGNLGDFDEAKHAVGNDALTMLDRWILERLQEVIRECSAAYASYDFRKVFITLNQFCAVDLSSLYVDATKDRMYCDAVDSPRRRSAQTAMHRVFSALCRLLAPVLAFTADEAWESAGMTGSVHEQDFPEPDAEFAPGAASEKVTALQRVRDVLMQEVDKARREKLIGSNLEADVEITVPDGSPTAAVLADKAEAVEFFTISDFRILSGPELKAAAVKSSAAKCERCWKQLTDVGSHADFPTLCTRCAGVIRARV